MHAVPGFNHVWVVRVLFVGHVSITGMTDVKLQSTIPKPLYINILHISKVRGTYIYVNEGTISHTISIYKYIHVGHLNCKQ